MADGQTQKDVVEALRRQVQAKNQSKYEHERAIAKDIERRRSAHRRQEKNKYQYLTVDIPQRTDMTFWLTGIGEAPKLGLPEEQKCSRIKSMKTDQYEMNRFRSHAVGGFIYWMKRDHSQVLARPQQYPSHHLPACNSLGRYTLNWTEIKS